MQNDAAFMMDKYYAKLINTTSTMIPETRLGIESQPRLASMRSTN